MTSPLPLITVITPSLNQGEFLEAAIKSVLNQGYPSLEYIVIDGDSTDSSKSILRKYSSEITYWVSEPDSGQADALGKALRRAKGTVIGWINADDYYLPQTLNVVGRIFASNPRAWIVYGDCFVVDRNDVVERLMRPGNFNLYRLLLRDYIPQPALFFRTSLLELIGSFDGAFKYALDYDFLLRAGLCLMEGILYVPRPLACFRLHEKSQSVASNLPAFLDAIEVRNKIFTNYAVPEQISSYKGLLYSHLLRQLLTLARHNPRASSEVQAYLREKLGSRVSDWENVKVILAGSDTWRLQPLVRLLGTLNQAWCEHHCPRGTSDLNIPPEHRWVGGVLMKWAEGDFERGQKLQALRVIILAIHYDLLVLLKKHTLKLLVKCAVGIRFLRCFRLLRQSLLTMRLGLLVRHRSLRGIRKLESA